TNSDQLAQRPIPSLSEHLKSMHSLSEKPVAQRPIPESDSGFEFGLTKLKSISNTC
ncbi:hypothetical protein A2U01_0073064, partial [Trifolium medium]|nr:hypothetical protein [Trifolium medium]